MVRFFLDTNICIYIAKQKPPEVLERFSQLEPGSVGMSFITYGELLYGVLRSQQAIVPRAGLQALNRLIPVILAHPDTADHYADIRAYLANRGQIIGNNDLWIAAHVRAENKVLVSNNLNEFTRVPDLKTENWVG